MLIAFTCGSDEVTATWAGGIRITWCIACSSLSAIVCRSQHVLTADCFAVILMILPPSYKQVGHRLWLLPICTYACQFVANPNIVPVAHFPIQKRLKTLSRISSVTCKEVHASCVSELVLPLYGSESDGVAQSLTHTASCPESASAQQAAPRAAQSSRPCQISEQD